MRFKIKMKRTHTTRSRTPIKTSERVQKPVNTQQQQQHMSAVPSTTTTPVCRPVNNNYNCLPSRQQQQKYLSAVPSTTTKIPVCRPVNNNTCLPSRQQQHQQHLSAVPTPNSSSLFWDRSICSSEARSTDSAILCFLLQFPISSRFFTVK